MQDSDKWTDKELEKLEKKLHQEYANASREIKQACDEYFMKYKARFEREHLAMETSYLPQEEIRDKWIALYGSDRGFDTWFKTADHAYGATKKEAEEAFKRWEHAQIGRGDDWKAFSDDMAKKLSQTTKIASGYVNDTLPIVYAKNSNYVSELAKQAAMAEGVAGIRFDLVNDYAIRRVAQDEGIFLHSGATTKKIYDKEASYADWFERKKSDDRARFKMIFQTVDIPKDERWNREKIQNALLQGVIQGDSIDNLTDRLMVVVGMSLHSAIRNARTSVTSAQNAGKQDRYEDLEAQGCEITKMWKATADERTREAHAIADGQEVKYDEPFIVGGEELMYPADPSGSGWNIYNCRCTMRTGKIKFKSVLSEEKSKSANIRIKE